MKVSIITVVFNGEKFIEDAIRSTLSQTHDDLEYILVDGKSTDGTVDIIKKYREKISIFKSEPDDGIYDAMNKGIALASGDIIGILNSDDIYLNDSIIENVVKEFQREIDCLFGDLVYVRPENLEKVVRYYDSSFFTPSKFGFGWMPAHPTFFVKREAYKKYGNFRTDLKIAADFDLMVRFLHTHELSFYHMKKPLIKMRTGGVSTSFSSLWINNFEILRVCRDNCIKTNMFKILSRYPSKLLGCLKR